MNDHDVTGFRFEIAYPDANAPHDVRIVRYLVVDTSEDAARKGIEEVVRPTEPVEIVASGPQVLDEALKLGLTRGRIRRI